ncbi:uncharacterized protein MONOS_17788 [Monocercomonoides exilis]|uniref:uncharacterized protein n=1 Tax=Monocercomonoides exilis TaxID=2049356 RepID=UPI00355985CC|nr:hypothetical protein MONOS_17788 [Monocercomonoides exilis]
METVPQALLAGEGFIAKKDAELLVNEKKTKIPVSSFSFASQAVFDIALANLFMGVWRVGVWSGSWNAWHVHVWNNF